MPIVKYLRGRVWWLRGTVSKQTIHETTGTSDEKRAEKRRARRESELWDRDHDGPAKHATFQEAVISYLETDDRSNKTKDYLERLLAFMGKVPLARIDQLKLDAAYGAVLRPGATNATKVRSVLTPLRAVMEHAARRDLCARPAFETPKIARTKTPVLTPDVARRLVDGAAPHLRPLLVFLLGTGCRMSEALELEWRHVDLEGARCTVMQKQGTERFVDLVPAVRAALSALPHREGAVFRPARHNSDRTAHQEGGYRSTDRDGGGQIRTAWATACARAGLPGEWREYPRADAPGKVVRRFLPELTPHALRHAWATWHYCVHRDIRKLQDDGCWETITMVTRYTKVMSPAHRDAILDFWAGEPKENGTKSAQRAS